MNRNLIPIILIGLALVGGGAVWWIRGGTVDVEFTSAVAADFNGGHAGTCELKGIVNNKTKYHLEGLSFKIGDYSGQYGEMEANSLSKEPETLITVTLDQSNATCADQARYLNENIAKASVFDCKLTNVPEGDCQHMVHLSSTISDDDINQLASFEQRQLTQALGPLRKAIAGLTNPRDDNQILDALVQLDAQSWSLNKYDVGSMNGATVLSQSSDGSERVVRANYTFNGGQQGWVKATLYRDTNALPCMQFWDFAEEPCHPLRLPDPSSYVVPVPMQSAPPLSAPNVPQADTNASGANGQAYQADQPQQQQPQSQAPVSSQNDESQQQPDQPAAPPQPPPASEDEVTSQWGSSPKP